MQIRLFFTKAHLLGIALSLTLFFIAHPSYAAFQWVAPSSSDVQKAPVIERAPSAFSEPQIIQAPLSAVPSHPSEQKNSVKDEDLVLGFADDVPLAVALRQILPTDVGFSVAQNVSLETLVSWQGGTSWRVTLNDMLSLANLESKEEGGMVYVFANDSSKPSVASPLQGSGLQGSGGEEPVLAASLENQPINLTDESGVPSLASKEAFLVPPPSAKTVAVNDSSKRRKSPIHFVDEEGFTGNWVATKGKTLREVLKKWARWAKVDLSWQSQYDYPLQATVSSSGSFEEAVRLLLGGFQNAEPQPYGDMHKNKTAGQTVLVIRARGIKNKD